MNNLFEIWDRFEGSNAVEMNFSSAEFSLVLRKAQKGANTAAETSGTITHTATVTADASKVAENSDSTIVCAPLAGIFYRSPSPEAKPFVMIGDEVKAGDVLGIIEAMKMMNEVTSPVDGIVEKVNVSDGEMTEYDAALFAIAKKQG